MIDSKKKSFAIQTLRRGSYRWYGRWQAEKASKIARNQYVCAICQGVFGKKDTSLDHVIPVVDPVKGFTSFDDYIDRLYCEPEGFQRLCNPCHDKKTGKENKVRIKAKKKAKVKKTKLGQGVIKAAEEILAGIKKEKK